MKTELGITVGRWEVKHSESKIAFNIVGTVLGGRYKIARVPYLVSDNEIINEREKQESLANAILIADAGTTANATGLLPSELLAQRDELREVLNEVLAYEQRCANKGNPIIGNGILSMIHNVLNKTK